MANRFGEQFYTFVDLYGVHCTVLPIYCPKGYIVAEENFRNNGKERPGVFPRLKIIIFSPILEES